MIGEIITMTVTSILLSAVKPFWARGPVLFIPITRMVDGLWEQVDSLQFLPEIWNLVILMPMDFWTSYKLVPYLVEPG